MKVQMKYMSYNVNSLSCQVLRYDVDNISTARTHHSAAAVKPKAQIDHRLDKSKGYKAQKHVHRGAMH